ncbi:MAG: hypothetical protein AAGB93_21790 [Planctomycetota bacterium]
MQRTLLAPLVLLAALASCQSMGAGVLSLEARALVLDDAEIDQGSQNGGVNSTDIDVEGYGVHAAVMTPIIDVLGGLEQREYGNDDTPELVLGVRRRFLEVWRLRPFVEGNVRYGFELDTGEASEDYFGWQVGLGLILDLTDHLFLNARLMYDRADIDTGSGSTDVDGLVGTLGIGWAF